MIVHERFFCIWGIQIHILSFVITVIRLVTWVKLQHAGRRIKLAGITSYSSLAGPCVPQRRHAISAAGKVVPADSYHRTKANGTCMWPRGRTAKKSRACTSHSWSSMPLRCAEKWCQARLHGSYMHVRAVSRFAHVRRIWNTRHQSTGQLPGNMAWAQTPATWLTGRPCTEARFSSAKLSLQ